MTVVPLPVPSTLAPAADDAPAPLATPAGGDDAFGRAVERAFVATGDALRAADGAERAFAVGRGGLQEMVLERARADVALSLAGAAAARVTQSLSTILGMQI